MGLVGIVKEGRFYIQFKFESIESALNPNNKNYASIEEAKMDANSEFYGPTEFNVLNDKLEVVFSGVSGKK